MVEEWWRVMGKQGLLENCCLLENEMSWFMVVKWRGIHTFTFKYCLFKSVRVCNILCIYACLYRFLFVCVHVCRHKPLGAKT